MRNFTPPTTGDSNVTLTAFSPGRNVRSPGVIDMRVWWLGNPDPPALGTRPVSATYRRCADSSINTTFCPGAAWLCPPMPSNASTGSYHCFSTCSGSFSSSSRISVPPSLLSVALTRSVVTVTCCALGAVTCADSASADVTDAVVVAGLGTPAPGAEPAAATFAGAGPKNDG